MRRIGKIWNKVCDRENLQIAFHKAARWKRDRADVRKFASSLEDNLRRLSGQLAEGSYQLGDYRRFTVHDPKERVIHSAPFDQRVIHHAVMNPCEPTFEARLIHHSYACRKGKGQYKALDQAIANARSYPFYLKLDIRKYFDSIPHDRLLAQLERVFKDRQLMAFWRIFLDSYRVSTGRGLPIGSLSSQHLANLYLNPLDRWLQDEGVCLAYVRYMDDFVVWGRDSKGLNDLLRVIASHLQEKLGLSLKKQGCIQRSSLGMDFLGYRIFPEGMRLNRRSWKRFRTKCRNYLAHYESGEWSQQTLAKHLQPLAAFAAKAQGIEARRRFLADFGVAAIGLEPC